MASPRSITRTTTIRLPQPVYEAARSIVEKEKAAAGHVASMNDLIVSALKAYLKMYKRRMIDAAFAGMAADGEYQKEAKLLAEEFQHSDWEALNLDAELKGAPNNATSSSR